jgi:hypothetical protein
MVAEYQSPTSAEARLDRSRRLWRAAFFGAVIVAFGITLFSCAIFAHWIVLPEWLLRHFD